MNIKRNTIANYIGQGYTILIGIAITPLYLQYLGAEAYGLVGFFALMQAWMGMLDLGLNPTLGRQVAFARGQKDGFVFLKRLLKSFELIFLALAALVIIGVYFASNWIATQWIKAETLSLDTLTYCITLMGFMIGLRWFAALYRSGINGMEDQVWLNIANVTLVSIKFIGVLLLLVFFTQEIEHFFEYQLVIGVIELLFLVHHFYSKMPVTQYPPSLFTFDWNAIKSAAPFALSVAYTAGIWILITQTDKLILSSVLPLDEFGYFSIIAMIMTGLLSLSSPLMTALLPKMTHLYSQGKISELNLLYRKATKITTIVIFSFSFSLIIYSDNLIYFWIKNKSASDWINPIIIWFTLGNAILIISGFQYALQQAHGKLRLHVIGSTISAIIQIPIIYFTTIQYGALGAGIAWFSIRLIWFLFWPALIHKYFLPKLHIKWLLFDVFPGILIAMIISYFIYYFGLKLNYANKTWLTLLLFTSNIITPIFVYAIIFKNSLINKKVVIIQP